MSSKIVKSTSKGQITLPKKWRRQFDTSNYFLEIKNNCIVVKPVKIQELEAEEVIFDANQDNDGKGVDLKDMIKMLQEIKNG